MEEDDDAGPIEGAWSTGDYIQDDSTLAEVRCRVLHAGRFAHPEVLFLFMCILCAAGQQKRPRTITGEPKRSLGEPRQLLTFGWNRMRQDVWYVWMCCLMFSSMIKVLGNCARGGCTAVRQERAAVRACHSHTRPLWPAASACGAARATRRVLGATHAVVPQTGSHCCAAQAEDALGMPQTGLFFVARARAPPGEPRAGTWVLPGVNKPVDWSWQARAAAGRRFLQGLANPGPVVGVELASRAVQQTWKEPADWFSAAPCLFACAQPHAGRLSPMSSCNLPEQRS